MKTWPDTRFAETPVSRIEVFFVAALVAFPQVQLMHSLLRSLVG